MQQGTAGYHGYWTLDFTSVDPHLGTNDDFRRFVDQAHARGLKVYMDIIVNHSADVIHFPDNRVDYLDAKTTPRRLTRGYPALTAYLRKAAAVIELTFTDLVACVIINRNNGLRYVS